jgi:hypothetical protein
VEIPAVLRVDILNGQANGQAAPAREVVLFPKTLTVNSKPSKRGMI